MQALAVGWSIYWRQALWIVPAKLVAIAAFLLIGNPAGLLGIYAGVGLLLLLLYGGLFLAPFCVLFNFGIATSI
jgi:hypothetical protein